MMKQSILNLREIQMIELGILDYFDNICRSNNLKYYLAYGTLIGAVRHKGFIPWDDDIDVMMPREDYYKLVKIMSAFENEYYKLISLETNKDFTAPLPKIIDTRTKLVQHYDYEERVPLGVYIDIFMLDGAKNSLEDAVTWYNDSFRFYRDWRKSDLALFPPGKSRVYGLLRYIKNIPYKMKGVSYYLNRMKQNNSKYSFYDSEYVSTLEVGTLPGTKCIWPQSFFEPCRTAVFEGKEFYVPCNYDAVLKSEYGDYMVLPPASKQVPHHVYTLEIEESLMEEIIRARN